jgi:hypothetical protein
LTLLNASEKLVITSRCVQRVSLKVFDFTFRAFREYGVVIYGSTKDECKGEKGNPRTLPIVVYMLGANIKACKDQL